MVESEQKLARAIRRLTVAVWCLCALIVAQLAFVLWSYVRAATFQSRALYTDGPFKGTLGTAIASSAEPDNDFIALPPDQKIRHATVIAITKYKTEGDKLAAIITEIPKLTPGTRFYYQVGQEFYELSTARKANEDYGDGNVVFLVGNPATMRESYSYSGKRIGALGQMPLDELRRLAKQKPRILEPPD